MPESLLDRGLLWVLWLQRASPALDLPMRLITLLGEAAGYLLLIPLLYWSVDRRLAVRLVLLFVLSVFVNTWAKEWVLQPRPFTYDLGVQALDEVTGGGLPSGHTQNAVVIWGYIALWVRKRWTTILAAVLMVLVPLSRMYLGAHFPTDLLGGYILGALLLFVFYRLEPAVSAWHDRAGLAWGVPLMALLPAALVLAMPATHGSQVPTALALLGAGVGYQLLWPPTRHEMTGTPAQRMVRWAVGTGGSALLALLVLSLAAPLALAGYFLLGLWVTVGTLWLFTVLGLAPRRPLRRRRSARPGVR